MLVEGKFVAREARQVLLAHRFADLGRLAIELGVVTPHQALQFRELADHRGQQVALADVGCAARERGVSADSRRDVRGQRADSRGLVVQRAELGLEGHALERFAVRVQAVLAVRGPEEGRVAQPRAHHALVAGDHLRGVRALDVRHGDEPWHQPPVRVAHREVALVILHGRDRYFGRQLQELSIEATGKRHGPLDQRRHFVEQRILDDRRAVEAGRDGGYALADGLAALIDVDHDPAALLQCADVGPRARDANRLRRHEPVAVGQVAGVHAQDLAGHYFAAKDHQHPVDRPHEFSLARTPAHALGDGQRVQCCLDDGWQQAHGAGASLCSPVHHPDALGGLELFECRDLGAAAAREGQRSLGGRPLCVECGLQRWAAPLDRPVGLLFDEPPYAHRKASRRGVALDSPVHETGAIEAFRDAVCEGSRKGQQRLWRQFLGTDLDQEVALCGHHATSGGEVGASHRILFRTERKRGHESPRSIGKPSASRLA